MKLPARGLGVGYRVCKQSYKGVLQGCIRAFHRSDSPLNPKPYKRATHLPVHFSMRLQEAKGGSRPIAKTFERLDVWATDVGFGPFRGF